MRITYRNNLHANPGERSMISSIKYQWSSNTYSYLQKPGALFSIFLLSFRKFIFNLIFFWNCSFLPSCVPWIRDKILIFVRIPKETSLARLLYLWSVFCIEQHAHAVHSQIKLARHEKRTIRWYSQHQSFSLVMPCLFLFLAFFIAFLFPLTQTYTLLLATAIFLVYIRVIIYVCKIHTYIL